MSAASYFTRTDLLRGLHCRRLLWWQRREPEAFLAERPARWGNGAELAQAARGLFPGGIDLRGRAGDDPDAAVLATQQAISEGHTVLYDAAFLYHGFFATVDILVLHRGRWQAFEVKASNRVKGPHLQDATFTWFVITGSGLALSGFGIIHLNGQYVRQGALSLDELFVREPVTRRVKQMLDPVRRQALALQAMNGDSDQPQVDMGGFCRKPEPCPFFRRCSALAGEALELDAARAALEDKQLAGPGVIVDIPRLREWLATLRYPLRFMDFEAYQTPVPEWDGHWAFRPIPFQFSMHRRNTTESEVAHSFFLAEKDGDPVGPFLEALLGAAGTEGTVLVYNRDFEHMVLEHLKAGNPIHAAAITALQQRLIDLMVPFKRSWVDLPALGEKRSLKQVLPALVPGMSYDGLAIADGADANKSFQRLRAETDADAITALRAALLEYCALDTFAMVLILDRFYTFVQE